MLSAGFLCPVLSAKEYTATVTGLPFDIGGKSLRVLPIGVLAISGGCVIAEAARHPVSTSGKIKHNIMFRIHPS
tara:strand:- start:441 stop:662 length:222 start_codon:yes stop_codon:yes gene_type:complete